MNENVARVLRGFINLSDIDKAAFIDELNRYQRGSYIERQNINESVQRKSSVGPKDSVCQCCGR
ncbi:MAG: hypothetical protein MUF43_07295 [Flavobacterium sp.]|jgi:hypothetical protein|nr:hypothetical protein [Flavobacterium sp.]